MRKSYTFGGVEKHTVTFHVNWLLGYCHFCLDGKTIFRRPFFLKIDKSFEMGETEKHIVRISFNLFDYFNNVLKVVVDGRDVTQAIESKEEEYHFETPVDDAAAALFYVAAINLVFSVIGTLFVSYLDGIQVRLMLMLGGLLYFFLGIKILSGSRFALIFGIICFACDSILNAFYEFSTGGLIIRLIVLYYLFAGLRYDKEILARK